MFNAATHVGANIAIFFCVVSRKCISKVDFPVPAFQVKKTFLPVSSIIFSAFFAIESKVIFDIVIKVYKVIKKRIFISHRLSRNFLTKKIM
jgi:hypothetical protein